MTQILLHAGLVNAALALLLAVPAALASRFLRHRPALVHGLWLLVLLKLITPPMFEVPLFRLVEETEEPATATLPQVPVVCECAREVVPSEPVELPAPLPVEEEVAVAATPLDWRTSLVVAWLSGAGVVWWLAFARLGRLERLLGQLPPANDDIQDRVRRLCKCIGLRRAPRLWLVPGVVPPLLLAFGRGPRLLVPTGLWARLDDDQRNALLLHELAHLRRGDPWVRMLELVVVGLFWWYPLAWWTGRALRDAEELCCDAWVVWAAPESASAYAGALVETVGFLSGVKAALPLVASGAAPVRFLYRRLSMILRHPPSRRLSPGALLALIVGGVCVLPMVPGLARTQSPAERPAASEQEGLTVERIVNASPSCRSCHGSPAKTTEWKDWRAKETGRYPDKMHDEIVQLLNVLTVQRASVTKTEKELRNLLDRFEAATGKKPAAAKEADKRLDDLEKKLKGILKELQELRRERRRPAEKSQPPAARGRQARDEFAKAQSLFDSGRHQEALSTYVKLLAGYPESVEGLEALAGSVKCYLSLGQQDKARASLQDLGKLLTKMPKDVREEWEKWLAVVQRSLE